MKQNGINFRQAEVIWDDPWRTVIEASTSRGTTVPDNRHWTAIWTPRDGNIRIISVRRARNEEIDRYEDNTGNG